MQSPRVVFAPVRRELVELVDHLCATLLIQGVDATDVARERPPELAQPLGPHDQADQDGHHDHLVDTEIEHISSSVPNRRPARRSPASGGIPDEWRAARGTTHRRSGRGGP